MVPDCSKADVNNIPSEGAGVPLGAYQGRAYFADKTGAVQQAGAMGRLAGPFPGIAPHIRATLAQVADELDAPVALPAA